MQNLFHGVREYLTPVLTESRFASDGVLTPEEFVQAGDLLVYKCPTWRWASGDEALRRPYLPADKQYLVTRNVPCRRRVTALEREYQSETPVEGEDEWVATQSETRRDGAGTEVASLDDAMGHISMDEPPPATSDAAPATGGQRSILDAIVDDYTPDLSAFEEDNLVDGAEDAAALPASSASASTTSGYLVAQEPDANEGEGEDAILYTRTYDLSITYDKYYQTPRVWLFGYDEANAPLRAEAVFEDIMQDYANRTVTMDPHPHHAGVTHASIHPCQHAAVMKRIVANLRGSGDMAAHEIRSDQYLFLFLKFIQSVVPTIDYDHTIEVNAKQ